MGRTRGGVDGSVGVVVPVAGGADPGRPHLVREGVQPGPPELSSSAVLPAAWAASRDVTAGHRSGCHQQKRGTHGRARWRFRAVSAGPRPPSRGPTPIPAVLSPPAIPVPVFVKPPILAPPGDPVPSPPNRTPWMIPHVAPDDPYAPALHKSPRRFTGRPYSASSAASVRRQCRSSAARSLRAARRSVHTVQSSAETATTKAAAAIEHEVISAVVTIRLPRPTSYRPVRMPPAETWHSRGHQVELAA